MNNPSLNPAFMRLLHSRDSMTANLEALGQNLSISLVQQGDTLSETFRATVLNLNQKAVITAYSSCSLKHKFFSTLLKNAATTPLGKFLFAADSAIKRNHGMQILAHSLSQLPVPLLSSFLCTSGFSQQQQFWVRYSTFSYATESLQLIEVILPQLNNLLNTQLNLNTPAFARFQALVS
jgi:chorismate-pyruvate lyase